MSRNSELSNTVSSLPPFWIRIQLAAFAVILIVVAMVIFTAPGSECEGTCGSPECRSPLSTQSVVVALTVVVVSAIVVLLMSLILAMMQSREAGCFGAELVACYFAILVIALALFGSVIGRHIAGIGCL